MKPKWCKNAIALTGSFGSGKSTVLEQLAALGAFVLSADDLAHQVIEPGTAAYEEIVQVFGEQLLNPDGSISRKALASRVFKDNALRRQLEAITHPAIRSLAEQQFEAALKRDYPLYVYEVPLLFEVGMESAGFKAIVVVSTPVDKAIARLTESRGVSREEATARLAAQLPLEHKVSRADFVIDNSGSLDELREKVKQLYPVLCELPD